ncbi:hypothetical protein [Streptomyces scopuliridis]|uniref:Uncharacterized protein n=1 Tax=Streptomyces scopuliridis RB72 TaxID=1440053 RepID=A0A2T7TDU8_9ACTN|nr:hypothetical protein [Streptomyces scopuliridis]PVE13271.1 hypothetical protein Y717_20710 [Streptomyces scopuliridis RB72]
MTLVKRILVTTALAAAAAAGSAAPALAAGGHITAAPQDHGDTPVVVTPQDVHAT